jgi:hypothetical protein
MKADSGSITQVVILALWMGAALLFAASVAPSAFAVLPSRTLAGAMVGRVLPVIFWSGVLTGLLAALLELRMASPSRSLVAASAFVAVACAGAHLVFGSRIARLREQIGGPVDALAHGDPLRVTFGRLHALSVLGLGVAMLAAAVALALASRATRR